MFEGGKGRRGIWFALFMGGFNLELVVIPRPMESLVVKSKVLPKSTNAIDVFRFTGRSLKDVYI